MKKEEYAPLSTQEAFDRINSWQSNPFTKQIRCGIDYCKAILHAKKLHDGEIIMVCKACDMEFSTRQIPRKTLHMTVPLWTISLEKCDDDQFGALIIKAWDILLEELCFEKTKDKFSILFATALAHVFQDEDAFNCLKGYAFKSDRSLQELTIEDIFNAAGNHVFDDFPEKFGISDYEGHVIRSFFQTINEKESVAIRKTLETLKIKSL